MKVLKVLLYILGGAVALILVLGLFAKKSYHIERSLDIKAPQALVGEQISCFKNFPKWSPWQDLDPNMKVTLPETDCQVGSVYAWAGNDQAGVGKMTITALAADHTDMRLDFIEPWEATSPVVFKFEEKDGVTKATWGMDMSAPFPMNAFMMLTDMDKAVGTDFEKGLAKLKALCEDLAVHPKYRGYEVTETDLPTRYYAAIRKTVTFADMGAFFHENMGKTAELTEKAGGKIAGPMSGLFWSYDESAGKSDCGTAAPLAEAQKLGGGVQVFTVNGGRAAVIDYYGPYEKTGDAHYAMDEYMTKNGLTSTSPVIEEYITDTAAEPDTAKWLTKIIYFVQPKAAEPQK